MKIFKLFRRKKNNKLQQVEDGQIGYPNYDVPYIKRDIEDLEFLLNTHGFYPEESGIKEVGVYKKDFLDITLDENDVLHLTITFDTLRYHEIGGPKTIKINMSIEEGSVPEYRNRIAERILNGQAIDDIPIWEQDYSSMFSMIIQYCYKFDFLIYDELLEYYMRRKTQYRNSAINQII